MTRRVLVSGRVQGVGFRWATRIEAQRLGVAGTVVNLADGRVEVHVGDDSASDALIEWLRTGPPGATVDDVAITASHARPPEGGFRIL